MFRRWLLRALTLTLLMLCVAAWVRSHTSYACVQYFGKSQALFLGGDSGWLWFGTYQRAPTIPIQWDLSFLPASQDRSLQQYQSTAWHWAGFALGGDIKITNFTVWIPLWFPTLLSALLLVFVWRMTRPQSHGQGFPIDPVAPIDNQKSKNKSPT